LVVAHIDQKILVQIESGFHCEHAVQFDSLRAPAQVCSNSCSTSGAASDRGELRGFRSLLK
jgi:hypothetical protein